MNTSAIIATFAGLTFLVVALTVVAYAVGNPFPFLRRQVWWLLPALGATAFVFAAWYFFAAITDMLAAGWSSAPELPSAPENWSSVPAWAVLLTACGLVLYGTIRGNKWSNLAGGALAVVAVVFFILLYGPMLHDALSKVGVPDRIGVLLAHFKTWWPLALVAVVVWLILDGWFKTAAAVVLLSFFLWPAYTYCDTACVAKQRAEAAEKARTEAFEAAAERARQERQAAAELSRRLAQAQPRPPQVVQLVGTPECPYRTEPLVVSDQGWFQINKGGVCTVATKNLVGCVYFLRAENKGDTQVYGACNGAPDTLPLAVKRGVPRQVEWIRSASGTLTGTYELRPADPVTAGGSRSTWGVTIGGDVRAGVYQKR